MFEIGKGKKYKVVIIKGGTGAKGDYTFITIEDKLRPGQKFADRLRINVWGKNLEPVIKKDDMISVDNVDELGIVNTQDKNDANKWYSNLTVTCEPDDIGINGVSKSNQENGTYTVPTIDTLDELPF